MPNNERSAPHTMPQVVEPWRAKPRKSTVGENYRVENARAVTTEELARRIFEAGQRGKATEFLPTEDGE